MQNELVIVQLKSIYDDQIKSNTLQMNKEVCDMLYEHALRESKKIEQKIKTLKKQLARLPDGKLFVSRSGKYTKWFLSDGKYQTYLPKQDRHLAEKLALKKYLLLQLKNLEQEQIAIKFYLRHHKVDAIQKEDSLINSIEYNELLKPFFKPISKELFEWTNSPYEQNKQHPEHLIHKTISGHYVRSKSEVMIDSVLYKNKISYRYECLLRLGDIHMYPDFTIRHPKTGETYYWEHFGLIEDANYSKQAFSKLQTYVSNGIIPTIHLITTYETKTNPLNIESVEKIVREYFLNE